MKKKVKMNNKCNPPAPQSLNPYETDLKELRFFTLYCIESFYRYQKCLSEVQYA